jgi:outer membrane protein assembly factor BamB
MMSRQPLRLWPGVVIVALQWLLSFGLPLVIPDAEIAGMPVGMLAVIFGALAGLLVAIWWLFFSRAAWPERIGAIALMVVAVIVTKQLSHVSIATAGQGYLVFISAVPYLCLALVIWATATRQFADGTRRSLLVVAILVACAPWTALRTDGVSSALSQFHWRWTPTPEALLLAQPALPIAEPTVPAPAPVAPAVTAVATPTPAETVPDAAVTPADWPGFRGPDRDGVIRGVRINTDWAGAPPVQLWRRPIGPGWSSFAVNGDLLYTQEQRGDEEMVSCHRVSTGEPVWRHSDRVRFYESNGGAGPRATPTLHGERVYSFGATGILNALDALTGKVLWSANVASDAKRDLPGWGFTSSPVIVGDLVIVAAAGTLAAYDRTSGQHRWAGPATGGSYSSPHRVVIDGVEQIVLLAAPGAISVAPADGTVLWTHEWEGGVIVQPAFTADGDIVISAMSMAAGLGTRRLHVSRSAGGWTVEERWTSNGLKPYFNDFVLHKGHAFGFDGNILASINLQDGKRNWKGGRYGNGQLILLADQDLLLVISEEGELVLVSASPGKHTEIARFQALEGKTWNHPVIVGNVLLVRNGQEMAAFRLSLLDR